MLGCTPLTTVLGAVMDPSADTALLASYVREVGRLGLALVFLDEDLTPMDPRPAVTAKRSPVNAPVDLATTDLAALQRLWKSYRKTDPYAPMRVGVDLEASGYAVVTCPNAVALHGFWEKTTSPMVIAPTLMDADGRLHYWFNLPDAVRPGTDVTDPSGWTLTGRGVAVIPPTAGMAVMGREWPAPAWIRRELSVGGVSV